MDLSINSYLAQCVQCKDTFFVDVDKRTFKFEAQIAFKIESSGALFHKCGGRVQVYGLNNDKQ